jgi:hypothetical protein
VGQLDALGQWIGDPPAMPVGFLRVADAWEWVGPVEDRPAADGNPGSRAATVGNWASNKQIMVDYMAQPASSRAKLAALGVDPVGFFLANGTGVPNVDDPAVYAAVADWQRAIEQTPSFKGEGLFEAFMSSGFVQAAAIAAGIYGLGSFVGGAAAAPLTETATLQAVTSSGAVSSSTAAAFAAPTSTAGLYSAAVQTAINTSVADYAAAAVAGETVGAAAAFTALPVSSLGPAVSAGFLESALEIAKGVKKRREHCADGQQGNRTAHHRPEEFAGSGRLHDRPQLVSEPRANRGHICRRSCNGSNRFAIRRSCADRRHHPARSRARRAGRRRLFPGEIICSTML